MFQIFNAWCVKYGVKCQFRRRQMLSFTLNLLHSGHLKEYPFSGLLGQISCSHIWISRHTRNITNSACIWLKILRHTLKPMVPTLSSLVAPPVVVMTISVATRWRQSWHHDNSRCFPMHTLVILTTACQNGLDILPQMYSVTEDLRWLRK